MSDRIIVTLRRGCYNLLDPREESLNLHVHIAAFSGRALNIGVRDRGNEVGGHEGDVTLPWGDLIRDVLRVWAREGWIGTDTAEIQRLRAWIGEDDNAALVDDAWARRRREQLAKRIERDRRDFDRLGGFLLEPDTSGTPARALATEARS